MDEKEEKKPIIKKLISWFKRRLKRKYTGKQSLAFLKKKAAHPYVDDDGNTFLHYAVMGGKLEHVTFLLEHENDFAVKNKYGLTPKNLALLLGEDECAEKLGEAKCPLKKFHIALPGDKVRQYSAEEFRHFLGVTYLPRAIFINSSLLFWFMERLRCMAVDQLKEEEDNYFLYHKSLIENNTDDLIIKWVDDEIGYGLFAGRSFKPGEFIGEYSGIIKNAKDSSDDNRYNIIYFRNRKNSYYIDAQDYGNHMRFMNHSSFGNVMGVHMYCQGIRRTIFIAWTPIQPGDQLLFDYGKNYWAELGVIPKKLT